MESQTLVHNRRPLGDDGWTDGPGQGALVLGRYRLRERLGAGGFGVVWSAHDERLGRDVAVKRVALAPGEDAERVTREALASARLSHPAIVALYEACPVSDAFYLISELVDGDTLAELIAADALSDAQMLQIGAALCDALAHAHARGVVHRDVKPQNVLVPTATDVHATAAEALAGVAKLADFGGAHLSGQEALTRTGDVLGTLAYMAPEQSEGREAGEAVDAYSLALVLYEALCGFNPVRGASPAETARRIGRPMRPLARARRDLPRALTQTIDRCLHRAPAARGTLEQLAGALDKALDEVTVTDPPRARAGIVSRDRRHDAMLAERTRRQSPATRVAPRTRSPRPAPLTPAHDTARAADAAHVPGGISPAQSPWPSPIAPAAPAESWGLPRLLWLALALALAVWQTAVGRPGVGLLALAALAPIALLPVARRAQGGSGAWLTCALAPALGFVSLAGAYPALAGQARRWRMRAAFGAVGYWWLVLAEPLLARRLWLGPSQAPPPRAVWEGSFSSAAVHVIGPLLSLGVLLGGALWAAGALALPLFVRGRSAALDVLAAAVWSAALATAAPMLDASVNGHAVQSDPRGAIVGAVLGGAVAVAARALRGPV